MPVSTSPSFEAHEFEQVDLRNGEALAAGRDHQGRNDGERQRNLDAQRGAVARACSAMSTVPPIRSMLVLTTSMPTPRPETLVMVGGGREAGEEDQLHAARDRTCARRFRRDQPALDRLAAHAFRIDAAAVVADLDVDLAAFVEGAQRHDALARLAARRRGLRRLDAVIDGVADDVRQRILDGLDDRLVELGLLAEHLDAGRPCRHAVARSRTTRGNLLQMLSIGCMRVFMTPSCSSDVTRFKRCVAPANVGIELDGAELQDLIAGQHELADQVHQLVEQADVDAQRGFGDGLTAFAAGAAMAALTPLLGRRENSAISAASAMLGGLDLRDMRDAAISARAARQQVGTPHPIRSTA